MTKSHQNGTFESAKNNQPVSWLELAKLNHRYRLKKKTDYVVQYISGHDKKEDVPIWSFLCLGIKILAWTADTDSKNHGLLIRVRSKSGKWHVLTIPAEMWVGDGNELRKLLANHGAGLPGSRKAKQALLDLFSMANPKETALCVNQTGWHGQDFIFPDRAITKDQDGKNIVYQGSSETQAKVKQLGSLEEWQDNIAAYAVGNSRLVGSISIGFASHLLEITGEGSGGFHWQGITSRGKTTILQVTASILGSGNLLEYLCSWRTTDSGLEGTAAAHSDMVLLLDEFDQITASAAYKALYMIPNGQGKVRANKSGQAQAVKKWRVLFISTGEISLKDKLLQSASKLEVMGGQKVRFLDIPMDAGQGLGAFENCHGMQAGQFADMLKDNTQKYYGTASPAFIQKVVDSDRSQLRDQIKADQKAFVQDVAANSDGLVQRAAARFALAAVAGELATQWNITGWNKGEATKAARRLFKDWLAAYGSATIPAEVQDGIKKVKAFLEQHGASRFTPWEHPNDKTINRCGFVEKTDSGAVYYILGTAWKNEVCKGANSQMIGKALVEIGVLKRGDNRNLGKLVTLPDRSRKRVYVIDESAFEIQEQPTAKIINIVPDERQERQGSDKVGQPSSPNSKGVDDKNDLNDRKPTEPMKSTPGNQTKKTRLEF